MNSLRREPHRQCASSAFDVEAHDGLSRREGDLSVSLLDYDLHGVGRTLALAGHVLLFVVDDDEPPESDLRPKMSALGR